MFLIDSNIIIYSHSNEYRYLRKILSKDLTFVSEVSRVEVLGFHKLTVNEESYFKDVFDIIPAILPNREIFDEAVSIRKNYRLKLGDSIIAATALVNDLTIYTRNIIDFEKINYIKFQNPII